MIIENYGYPRRGKGHYIKAEVYDTVTEFIDDYEDSSKKRLKRRWYELLMRKDYQDVIVRTLASSKESFGNNIGGYSEFELPMFDIELVDRILLQPEMKIWYDNYHSKKESDDNYFSLMSSIHDDLIDNLDSQFEPMLYRIAQFKFELMPDFSFDENVDVPSVGCRELVITGDEVLNFKTDCRYVSFNAAADIFGHRDTLYEFPIFKSGEWLVPEETEINCKPDNWDRVILRLYLSEDMHYHLWIRLDDVCHIDKNEMDCDTENYERFHAGIYEDGLVRNIVIKNLCRINYLKEIEMIRKWCGWPCDFNDDIKREVAKVGGYVPGAEVL